MSEPVPSRLTADQNLLFGVLALQMDFLSRDALIQAMNTWALEKARPLGRILVDQGILPEDTHDLVEALVRKHLEGLGNDPERHATLSDAAADPYATRPPTGDSDPHATGTYRGAIAPQDWIVPLQSTGPSRGRRFRILRPHARGGLGEVFVAHDEELHREVALKQIQGRHADDPSSRARFLLEAEVTGRLEHPGVVPIYSLGHHEDGRPFYAMRFIRGHSLEDAIAQFHKADVPADRDPGERALALRQLLSRFLDVCNAIAYAHSRGILHRDLKPANILLGPYGETLVVDWGLAKPIGRPEGARTSAEDTLRPASAGNSAGTQIGSIIGTPAYMSPEQAAGRLDLLGPASDVYSLGATLYCLLTGHAPVEDPDLGVLLHRVCQGAFPPPRQVNHRVPAALEAICLKALALKSEERYPSPRALADDLVRWLADEPVSAYREPLRTRWARWGRRHKTLVTGGAVLLVTAVVALTAGLLLLGHKQAEVVQARNQAQRINTFYEDRVLAAGWAGGMGEDVMLREALDRAAAQIGELADQPEAEATVRNTLGMTYYHLGRFADANPHLEKAYAIRREQLGANHPDTLTSLLNLAMLRCRQGALAQAIPLGRQALEGRRRLLGPEAEDTLWAQVNLGDFLSTDDQLEEAEAILGEAVASCRRQLPPDHPCTLRGQHELAVVLWEEGQRDQSLDLFRQTLEGWRRLRRDHRDERDDYNTLYTMGSLGWRLTQRGQLEEAEPLCRESLEGRRRLLGEEHMETLWSEYFLAEWLRAKGDSLKAEKPELAGAAAVLVVQACAEGEYREAEKLLRHCLAGQRKRLGEDHTEVASTLGFLGDLLAETGRPAEAETVLGECLAIWDKKTHPDPHEVARACSSLGAALARQGKFAEAEPLLLSGYDGLAGDKAASARERGRALDRIVELYDRSDKPDRAEEWRRKRSARGEGAASR